MAEQKEEITALPWRVNPYSTHIDSASVSGAICKFESKHGFYDNHVANAAYIVLACNAYPSLLKENEELRKALEYARPIVERWCHTQGNIKEFFEETLAPIDTVLKDRTNTRENGE
jgi:hypothetical protein